MPVPPVLWSGILFHRLQAKNKSPKSLIGQLSEGSPRSKKRFHKGWRARRPATTVTLFVTHGYEVDPSRMSRYYLAKNFTAAFFLVAGRDLNRLFKSFDSN